jgi:dTDP-glucose 4,6-dehydratase
MQNILVTGGAGFIGSNFVHTLLDAEPDVRVVNLDVLTYAGSLENLADLAGNARHLLIRGDICDADLVHNLLRTYQIDTLVHFAAESHVDRSIITPERFIQTNIVGTFNLLEQARSFWMVEKSLPPGSVRFHHVSTDEVYGSLTTDAPAFSEFTPYAPNSPYAASKASSDHLVRSYAHTYGLPITISNCSNNYGPQKLIPLTILNAVAGKPLPVYGDGRQVRDWLYVGDHCDALHKILVSGKPGETYNIGGGNQPTNLSVVETICDLLDELHPTNAHRQLITFVTDRPGHDRRYAMDTAKIEHELGWRPAHSLAAGLRETVAWYMDNLKWAAVIQEQDDYRHWMNQNYQKREKHS